VKSIMPSNPVALLADAGVPMIFITWPGMVLLLLPIIAAEAVFIIRRTALPRKKVIWATTAANAVSTILGIPLTWGLLFFCEMGLLEALSRTTNIGNSSWNSPLAQITGTILSAPWIAPVGESGRWAVPLAALVLLIPFFFVSVWVEQRVMKHFFPLTAADGTQEADVSDISLRKAVWGANLLSYGFLFAFATTWLVWGAVHR
jgi:hypothetical protein